MHTFAELKKNLKKDFSNLKLLKVALLGDSATQLLVQSLRGAGYNAQLNLEIWEANFNQIEQQIFNAASELYKFAPDVIIIFHSAHKLLNKYDKSAIENRGELANDRLNLIENLYTTVKTLSRARVIYFNYPEIDDAVFNSYANKLQTAFLFQLRKLNYKLMTYAEKTADFYLGDMSSIQNQVGKSTMYQPALYVNTEMILSLDSLPLVAEKTVALLTAIYCGIKKCVILDLDNTLWGGVIGDDGLENIQLGSLGIGKAFTEFQYWLKKLKDRGIILAVCSKNTEVIAKQPFESHPDMVLRLSDIAVFMANWDNKVENIYKIQSILNIGFDSMVFLDDNPFERNMVRGAIPALTIPELPEDPANYLEYLYTLNLFETASFSNQDLDRTEQYRLAADRAQTQANYVDEASFLKSLNMLAVVEPFDKFNTPRVAQLSQRSNQFNLRTIRYTEADIALLVDEPGTFTFAFNLKDKFGDNGLISIVVLKSQKNKTLFIDSWLMSCRVLKRGMENFVLNTLVNFAREKGITQLKGEFVATGKNEMVAGHYENYGFKPLAGYWMLPVDGYETRECFIKEY